MFMKKGNLDNWADINKCKNLLFFAQLVNELLFDYSIPSNRISTLNTHYLCYDAISTIHSIDYHGVPEGTLKPIMKELYVSLSKDVVFSLCGESPLKYFVKYQKENYRYTTNTDELNYDEAKKVVFAINKKYFCGSWYISELKSKIRDIIIENKEESQQNLFRLTKSMLTELINAGYSTKYIYEQTNRCFYNRQKEINSPEEINTFLNTFDFKDQEFSVIFIVNKQQILIQSIDNNMDCLNTFPARTTTLMEKKFLQKEPEEKYLILKVKEYDPYVAAEYGEKMLDNNAAFYKMYDHNYKFNINSVRCGVYDESNYFTLIEESKSAVQRVKTPSKEQIRENMNTVEEALKSVANNNHLNEFFALLNAASFHSLSLDSASEQNQLLDLWSIFETILDISNKHTNDRIQQICMYLVPILKRRYIYSLFLQLANDIKNYSVEKYNEITNSNMKEFETVKSICNFIILEEHKHERDAFLSSCNDFPLLKERIEYYNQMLSTPYKVYQFVEKHSERVRWQIMRIYRNRNLIIHNGESMPYLKLLIENLHSYVDDFLNYTVFSLSKGNSLGSMCQELFSKECDWLTVFGNKKATMSSDIINTLLLQ